MKAKASTARSNASKDFMTWLRVQVVITTPVVPGGIVTVAPLGIVTTMLVEPWPPPFVTVRVEPPPTETAPPVPFTVAVLLLPTETVSFASMPEISPTKSLWVVTVDELLAPPFRVDEGATGSFVGVLDADIAVVVAFARFHLLGEASHFCGVRSPKADRERAKADDKQSRDDACKHGFPPGFGDRRDQAPCPTSTSHRSRSTLRL